MPLARINGKILLFVHIPKSGGSSIETYLQEKGPLGFKLKGRKGWCKTVPQHVHAELYKPMFPDGFVDETFTVFRDPIQRILSEFRYRSDRSEVRQPFSTWLQKSFEAYEKNPYALDNHLRPQVEYLRRGVKVFRFEDGLDNVFRYIDDCTQTGHLPAPIWEKKSKSAKPELSDADMAMLTEFYAKDIKAYGALKEGAMTVWGT